MDILLIGDEDSDELTQIQTAAETAGHDSYQFAVDQWPSDTQLTVALPGRQATDEHGDTPATGPDQQPTPSPTPTAVGGEPIPVEAVDTCYVDSRGFSPTVERHAEALEDEFYPAYTQLREHAGVVTNLINLVTETGGHRVNPRAVAQLELRKVEQLARFAAQGLATPATIVTNDPERVDEFRATHETVIAKPVTGGGSARILTDERWNAKRDRLSYAPVQFQEHIEGDDVRIYLTRNRVLSAHEIHTSATDYRTDATAEFTDITTDPAVKRVAAGVQDALPIGFGAVDAVKQPDGTLTLLEVNTAPMFAHYARTTGTDIAAGIVREMERHTGD